MSVEPDYDRQNADKQIINTETLVKQYRTVVCCTGTIVATSNLPFSTEV